MKDRFMEAAPDTGSGPDHETAMGRRLRYPEARRQGPPGTPAHRHVDDRREQRLIKCVLVPPLADAPGPPGSKAWRSPKPSGTIQLHVPRPMTSPASEPHRTPSKFDRVGARDVLVAEVLAHAPTATSARSRRSAGTPTGAWSSTRAASSSTTCLVPRRIGRDR